MMNADDIVLGRTSFATCMMGVVFWVMALCVSAQSDESGTFFGLRLSKDTLFERGYVSANSMDEVWLINRGYEEMRVDSISVRVDRKEYPTVSMDFVTAVRRGVGWESQQVFFWSDGKAPPWLSQPLVIPPRDSLRLYYLRMDSCAKCNAQRESPSSRDMTATVRFHSNRGVVDLVVRAWYRG